MFTKKVWITLISTVLVSVNAILVAGGTPEITTGYLKSSGSTASYTKTEVFLMDYEESIAIATTDIDDMDKDGDTTDTCVTNYLINYSASNAKIDYHNIATVVNSSVFAPANKYYSGTRLVFDFPVTMFSAGKYSTDCVNFTLCYDKSATGGYGDSSITLSAVTFLTIPFTVTATAVSRKSHTFSVKYKY